MTWLDMDSAPRNGEWIEVRFIEGEEQRYKFRVRWFNEDERSWVVAGGMWASERGEFRMRVSGWQALKMLWRPAPPQGPVIRALILARMGVAWTVWGALKLCFWAEESLPWRWRHPIETAQAELYRIGGLAQFPIAGRPFFPPFPGDGEPDLPW